MFYKVKPSKAAASGGASSQAAARHDSDADCDGYCADPERQLE
jgi:hypothetical protein